MAYKHNHSLNQTIGKSVLRTVPTIVTAHLELLGFPTGGAY